jgi:hypothetical protein
MKVYQTNAALGYNQLAFLIRLDKSTNGYNNKMYEVGKVVEDLKDYYLEDTTYKVEDSPLNGTYLFEFFKSTQ